ncbi:MAG: hypothetical protein HRU17_00350 [Polyangiaceae bacterium]|nr:hypothetical protein [Polyangiaceae bacterium]
MFYESVVDAVDTLNRAVAGIELGTTEPRGTIRVTTPSDLGRLILIERFAEFLDRYPKISRDLIFANRVVDLVEERVDVALRGSAVADPNWIARPFMSGHLRLAAAPDFPVPDDIHELEGHNFVLHHSPSGSDVVRLHRPTPRASATLRRFPLEMSSKRPLSLRNHGKKEKSRLRLGRGRTVGQGRICLGNAVTTRTLCLCDGCPPSPSSASCPSPFSPSPVATARYSTSPTTSNSSATAGTPPTTTRPRLSSTIRSSIPATTTRAPPDVGIHRTTAVMLPTPRATLRSVANQAPQTPAALRLPQAATPSHAPAPPTVERPPNSSVPHAPACLPVDRTSAASDLPGWIQIPPAHRRRSLARGSALHSISQVMSFSPHRWGAALAVKRKTPSRLASIQLFIITSAWVTQKPGPGVPSLSC